MNKTIQTITFGKDPELKTYGTDGKICTFSGATKKRFAKEGESDTVWSNYVAFGKTAEFIAKYFKKGSKALVESELDNNNYEKDGVKHYGYKLIVNNIEFFGKKEDGNVSNDTSAPTESNTKTESKSKATSYDEYDDF